MCLASQRKLERHGAREMLVESITLSRRDFDAAIFDLDGVLTETARVHAAAWKAIFDAFLQRWAQQRGLAFRPFDIEADYLKYVDGRPRHDGIRNFLSSRGINLPEGSEHDPEDADTVHALGERKTRLFLQALKKGIDPAAGAKALLDKLREAGIRTAVGSSSKNTSAILQAAGTRASFRCLRRRACCGGAQVPGKAGSGTVSRGSTPSQRSAVACNFVRGCVGWGRGRQTGRLRMRGRPRSWPATRGVTSTRCRCRHQELARGARRAR